MANRYRRRMAASHKCSLDFPGISAGLGIFPWGSNKTLKDEQKSSSLKGALPELSLDFYPDAQNSQKFFTEKTNPYWNCQQHSAYHLSHILQQALYNYYRNQLSIDD